MLLHRGQSVFIALAMVLAGFLTACQSTPTSPVPSAPGIGVGITDETCPNAVVQVGQQVTWTNQDTREHIVRDRLAQGNGRFDSGTLQPGDSFAFTFLQSGSYTYECSVDGAMTGTVTVQP